MAKTFITAPEVAELLEYDSAAAFLRQRERLETDTDFPPPAPLSSRPLKWRREAVEHWKAQQGLADADDSDEDGQELAHALASGKVSLLAAARTP